MKLALFVALVTCGVAVAGGALAQQNVRPNERYCIEVVDETGPNPWLCRFETYEQCFASRTSPGDRCWLNPYLGSQPRR